MRASEPRHPPTTAGSPTKVAQALYEAINRHDFDAGFALLDPGFEWIVHEHGDRVAVPVRQRATGGASGVELEIRIGHLWTVRDGKALRLEVFPAREDAERAAAKRAR